MLAKDLLKKIEFTDEMIAECNKHFTIFGKEGDRLARAYMREGKDFNEALAEMRKIEPQANEYMSNLIFILECTGYAYEDYKAHNISDEIFYDSFKELTYKMNECKAYKGVWGNFVPDWEKRFLDLNCFQLGRLQYNYSQHIGDEVTIDNFVISEGDNVVGCHIPSSGPLLQEDVVDSLKRAYEFFYDKRKNGILIVECFSWFFCPNYVEIFKENAKNIYSFTQNFHVYYAYDSDVFNDIWRVFGVEPDDYNADELKEDTRLQKAFKKHIKEGKKFGGGRAVILFDGENILTRKDLNKNQ